MARIECNGCGGCCDPVSLPWTPIEMRTNYLSSSPEDRQTTDFATKHWTMLTRAEAVRRAPWINDGKRRVCVDPLTGETTAAVFYECDRYDRETKQCLAYDERPPACRGYPWYGGEPTSAALPPECSFREEQPVELGPTRHTL